MLQREIYNNFSTFITNTKFPKPPTKTPKPQGHLEHYIPDDPNQIDLLPHMVFFDNLALILYGSGPEAVKEYCQLKIKHPQSFHEIPPVKDAIKNSQNPSAPFETRLKFFISAFSIVYDSMPAHYIPLSRIFLYTTFNSMLPNKDPLTRIIKSLEINRRLRQDLVIYILTSPSMMDFAQDKVKKITIERRERKIYEYQGEKYVIINKEKVNLEQFISIL
jgi:hypothetical protein